MATDNAQGQEQELQVEELADGTVKVVDPTIPATAAPEDTDDAAHTEGGGEDDGSTEQEELATATDDAEREAIRERRRKERKDRKVRTQEREATLRRELAQSRQETAALAERMAAIEGKTTGSELAQLDAAIAEAGTHAESYKRIIAEATNRSDGAAVADATQKMFLATTRETELKRVREAHGRTQGQQPRPGTQRPAEPPPRLVALAKDWMSKNTWYNPQGDDPDSAVAATLDRNLAREGFDPTTEAYWDELSARVKKYIPHRAGGNSGILPGDTNSPGRKPTKTVPVTGSSRESAATGGREFTLSAERVQALKDAGLWDDPKSRADGIRRYRDFDRTAASATKT